MNASHEPHSPPWICNDWRELGFLVSHHCCSSLPPGQLTTNSAQPTDSSRGEHPPTTESTIPMAAQLRNARRCALSAAARQSKSGVSVLHCSAISFIVHESNSSGGAGSER